MQPTHQAWEPSHIGIQASGPLQPGSHLELQTQRDRLWLLRGLMGIKWTEGSRCQPATGSKRLLAMLCCGLSEVFWTLLDPKGSEVLALWPLPQGGTATLPPPQLSHLHAAQQGPWQLCSGQGQAPQGLDGLPAVLSRASASAVQLWAHAHHTTLSSWLPAARKGPAVACKTHPSASRLPTLTPQPSVAPHCPQALKGLKLPCLNQPPDPSLPARVHLRSACLDPP